ncbi:beta-N-acetylhexosaminidase [Roseomonas elaeocarpi]|uniref:beta-N-acetylhexosaminidase n=1 Tax=Roseomonas elaeocarpi TaxID=907779 RepID=A0ABV6JY60_9PROT
MSRPGLPPRAAILGIAGTELTPEERELFRRSPPLGVILFGRNIDHPAQLRRLTASLREVLGEDAPILVDQEGGRVARLRPPHWPAFPAAGSFGDDPEAVERNYRALGATCRAEGFDVVCAPVLDLRQPGAHDIVGDRAFGDDPATVARLGARAAAGLRAAGCVPVLKHMPGHGRALADSHLTLPRVAAGIEALEADFAPFRALCAADGGQGFWGMTAHLLYAALDEQRPATLSPRVINGVIRGEIGFRGLLLTDDLAMRALYEDGGDPASLAVAALDAGCDVALHCPGIPAENAAVLSACPPVSERALEALAASRQRLRPAVAAGA